ncbi:hypothetical protein [Peribacillus simplex]|nr:hypothetical protein [Peribacillus simplex]WHY95660.1 hypothetical protein QNH37_16845 [Peribacillus simplex]
MQEFVQNHLMEKMKFIAIFLLGEIPKLERWK